MRQAGILAAAGLVALEETPRRLGEDHRNAKFLAEGLARIPGISIDPAKVETNIVVLDVAGTGLPSAEISARAKALGLLFNGINERTMRMVTHYDVDRAACARALEVVEEATSAASSKAAS
jgi:threonine aldolase